MHKSRHGEDFNHHPVLSDAGASVLDTVREITSTDRGLIESRLIGSRVRCVQAHAHARFKDTTH